MSRTGAATMNDMVTVSAEKSLLYQRSPEVRTTDIKVDFVQVPLWVRSGISLNVKVRDESLEVSSPNQKPIYP